MLPLSHLRAMGTFFPAIIRTLGFLAKFIVIFSVDQEIFHASVSFVRSFFILSKIARFSSSFGITLLLLLLFIPQSLRKH